MFHSGCDNLTWKNPRCNINGCQSRRLRFHSETSSLRTWRAPRWGPQGLETEPPNKWPDNDQVARLHIKVEVMSNWWLPSVTDLKKKRGTFLKESETWHIFSNDSNEPYDEPYNSPEFVDRMNYWVVATQIFLWWDHPDFLGGRWTHFDDHIFWNGLVQPPTRLRWCTRYV